MPLTQHSILIHDHVPSPTELHAVQIAASAPDASDKLGVKLIAGGLSCMIISAVLNPLDVIKVKLQTQNQLQKLSVGAHQQLQAAQLHNPGFLATGSSIWREQGYRRGLMKGFTASMMREASYSSVRMGLYDFVKACIAPSHTSKDEFKLWQKLVAGMVSGALGSALATPTDLVKIRFQSYGAGNPNPYRNTFHAISAIAQTGGITALYKGAVPTIVRASLLTSSQLASYDQTKRTLLHSGYFYDNSTTHLTASLVSGLVTATVVNPADVIKTRIMTDLTLYSGPLDCLVKTVKTEGLRALMKGWWPNYCRLGPHFIVSLPLAEYIRTSLGADTF